MFCFICKAASGFRALSNTSLVRNPAEYNWPIWSPFYKCYCFPAILKGSSTGSLFLLILSRIFQVKLLIISLRRPIGGLFQLTVKIILELK